MSKARGNKCQITHCGKSDIHFPHLTFFNFPKDDIIREKWIEKCGNIELVGASYGKLRYKVICEEHFLPDVIVVCVNRKKKLMKTAVPSRILCNISGKTGEKTNEHFPLTVLTPTKTYLSTKSVPTEVTCSHSQLSPTSPSKRNLDLSPFNTPEKLKKRKPSVGKILFVNNDRPTKLIKHENIKLRNKIKILQQQIRKRNILITRLQSKISKKPTLRDMIDQSELASEEAKTLCKMQLLHKKGTPWTEDEKRFALDLHYRSPGGYRYLKAYKNINLPGETIIKMWSNILKLSPGFNDNVIKALTYKTQFLSKQDKLCAIVFDEMALRKCIQFCPYLDLIEGYEDLGELGRKQQYCTEALVFMIRGIHENYKFPFAYFLSKNSVNKDNLSILLKQCIEMVNNCGFNVVAIVCDQSSVNQSTIKKLGVTPDKPFFHINDIKIYAIFDAIHLFKNIRNRLKENDFYVSGNKIVSWKDILNTFLLDKKCKRGRSMGHLSDAHMNPNSFQKMSAHLATQIFSNKTSSAIKTASATKVLQSSTAMDTAEFLERMNNLVDILNSKHNLTSNPFSCAISNQNDLAEILKSFATWIESWKIKVGPKSKVREIPPCFTGLIQTVNAICGLWKDFANSDVQYLCTNRLNQDCIENCFSQVRGGGGFNMYPSAQQFRCNLENIIVHRIDQKWLNGNSNLDNSVIISLSDILKNSPTIDDNHEDIDNEDLVPSFGVDRDKVDNESEHISEMEHCSVVYFAGYIAYKSFKKFLCEQCVVFNIKDNETVRPSDLLITHRSYETITGNCCGNLCVPSDNFINVIEAQLTMFSELYNYRKHEKHLSTTILHEIRKKFDSAFPDFFNGECYNHRIYMLKLLIAVKLFKETLWETKEISSSRKKSHKLRVVANK